jgi:hypothetical protein
MDDVRAVMDDVGSERAAVYGLSEGAARTEEGVTEDWRLFAVERETG